MLDNTCFEQIEKIVRQNVPLEVFQVGCIVSDFGNYKRYRTELRRTFQIKWCQCISCKSSAATVQRR